MNKRITYLLLFLFAYTPFSMATNLDDFFEQSEEFFSTYAQHSSVQYKVLQKDPKALDNLIGIIAAIDVSNSSAQEKKAFYINAYNLLVINNVVQYYPIASPNEIVEFWDEIEHQVEGKTYTLETFKARIFQEFPDPHLHFVLVDGALGSAPIADFAYNPTTLDQQLENRTIETLNNSKFVQYDKVNNDVLIPRIFKTKAADFQPSIIAFINNYRAQKFPEDVEIKFAHYDWTLNSFFGDTDIAINIKKKKTGYSPLAQVITLPKNAVELIFFNSIFTVQYGDKNFGSRSTYYNGMFSAYYGVNGTLDIGVNFLLRSSRLSDGFNSSPFKVFEFERSSLNPNPRSNQAYSDWGFSHLGVQVRFAPFKSINLSFEQGVLMPIKHLPRENSVDESIYSITQVYYQHSFSSQLQLFLALTFWQPIMPGETFKFQPPMLRGFLNYFATPRFSVFVTTMYGIEWGLGAKLMLTPKFELQAMYSYFLPIPGVLDVFSPGATSVMTMNMGLRYRF